MVIKTTLETNFLSLLNKSKILIFKIWAPCKFIKLNIIQNKKYQPSKQRNKIIVLHHFISSTYPI